MPNITTLKKPEIWLAGNTIEEDGSFGYFSGIVDHSKTVTDATAISGPVVSSGNILYKNKPLTFKNSVRIVITGKVDPKYSYHRKNGELSSLEFEGKANEIGGIVGNFADTYYTLNGKIPNKTKSYLYNFKDRDEYVVRYQTGTAFLEEISKQLVPPSKYTVMPNPSDEPSALPYDVVDPSQEMISIINPSAPGETTTTDNINDLGFVLKKGFTGNNVITLMARTFFRGQKSDLAIAYFKIYEEEDSVFDNLNNND